jgi:uncharacterized protein
MTMGESTASRQEIIGGATGSLNASSRVLGGQDGPVSDTAPAGLAEPERMLQIPFHERRLNLSAVPSKGTFVQGIDLDLTVACNLRCRYCFKEKWNEHMEERVAFDAVCWLLHASGPAQSVNVNFMGGEPLLRFELIKKLVPFGKRRARQRGKRIHFGVTTNATLVTDEIVEFWRTWGMGFHTSVDGIPDIQDRTRPMTSGRGSSHLVEKCVPKILEYRPGTTARCTIVPESVSNVLDNYRYFRSRGYLDIALVPGMPHEWDEDHVRIYEEQFQEVGNALIEDMRSGTPVTVKWIDDYAEAAKTSEQPKYACGAGRGMALIDIHGDIWPCHRWNKQSLQNWRIGSIYEDFDELAREQLDTGWSLERLKAKCDDCEARVFCGGGCPAENLDHSNSVFDPHPVSCELHRIGARVGKYVHDTLHAERNPTFMEKYYPEPPQQ